MIRAGKRSILLIVCVLAGCAGKIDVGALEDPVDRVCDRHDRYILADVGLDPVDADVNRGESARVRQAVADAKAADQDQIHVKLLEPPILRVCDRHDGYVEADPDATALRKRVWLRTTELLRRLVREAKR